MSKKRIRGAIVEQLRRELSALPASPGSSIPSCREWSRKLGYSYSSVHRALVELGKEGLIQARDRSGWYRPAQTKRQSPAAPRRPALAVAGQEVVLPFLPFRSANGRHFLSDRGENWTGTILSSLARALGQRGMRLSLLDDPCNLEPDKLPPRTIELIDAMPQPPAGVIMFAQPGLEAFRGWLRQRAIPNLTIGVADNSTTADFVSTDFREMGRVAGVAFGSCGFDRVVYLYGNFHLLPSERQRLEGFCSGFAETTGHLPAALGFGYAADSPREFGWRALQDYLQRASEPPQAVFAAGDYLAIGAIQALRDHGLRCPEQVAVIGATGLDFAGLSRPSITTIDQPMEELGQCAASMLWQMCEDPRTALPGIILPSRITFRESFPASPDLLETLRTEFRRLVISCSTPAGPLPEADRPAPVAPLAV